MINAQIDSFDYNNLTTLKMKYSVYSALISAIAADAPPYFNEPPFAVSSHPAAAGLVQVESACAMYGVKGVSCAPGSNALFATGMNGDEDLGEDITMKGDKFHFAQHNLVQFATGMNGDEDMGEDITMKGDKFHFAQNVQLSAEPAAKPSTGVTYDTKGYGANGGVEKLSFFDPKVAKAHTSFYNKK